jgi:hypothetical protein
MTLLGPNRHQRMAADAPAPPPTPRPATTEAALLRLDTGSRGITNVGVRAVITRDATTGHLREMARWMTDIAQELDDRESAHG